MGETSRQAIVKLKNLNKSYKEKKILNNINLEVMQGEFVAIIGKSGSGKSTLLNIIGLLDVADAGSVVELFGEPVPPIHSSKARTFLRSKIAYIFQNAALIDQDSVEANLKLAQRYSGLPKDKQSLQRKAALASVGLDGMEKQKVYQLSGGEQQRLAVACMQMHPSELMLADEPTGSLDPTNRDTVMSSLVALQEQGKALIVVTHDQDIAHRADKVVSLDVL